MDPRSSTAFQQGPGHPKPPVRCAVCTVPKTSADNTAASLYFLLCSDPLFSSPQASNAIVAAPYFGTKFHFKKKERALFKNSFFGLALFFALDLCFWPFVSVFALKGFGFLSPFYPQSICFCINLFLEEHPNLRPSLFTQMGGIYNVYYTGCPET